MASNKRTFIRNRRKLLNPVFHLQTKNEEEQIITRELIIDVRKTGKLNLTGRNLTSVPVKLFKIYEFTDQDYNNHVDFSKSSDDNDDNWWNYKPLTYLDLSSNQLTEIPEDIKLFDNLETLILQNNNLTKLPKSIDNLTKLQTLNLSRNKIQELPIELCNLEILKLTLSFNMLDKCNQKLSDMVMLKYLDLSSNRLIELPSGLGYLVRLIDLDLSNNKLTELPPDIVNMRSLLKLNINNNELKYLPEIGEMRKLEILFSNNNNIQTLPEFQNSENLKELHLANNYIKEIPILCCENLHRLEILNLSDNKINELPNEIGMLRNLSKLNLINNGLETLPTSLGFLPHLEILQIEGNKMKQLRGIRIMIGTKGILQHLRENETTDEFKDLNLNKNEPIKFPDKYKMMETRTLNLSMKELESIPNEVFEDANKVGVTRIDICRNKLKILPSGLDLTKTHLQELNVSINLLKELPEFLGNFINLMYLDLSRNRLNDLPNTLSLLENLKELVILNNDFIKIPNCVFELLKLEIFIANDNKIDEINVKGFKNLKNLTILNLSNNSIRHVPPEIGFLPLRSLEIQGNLFRQPRHTILEQGTESILAYLRDRMPKD